MTDRPKPGGNAGAGSWTLFIDAIDEAQKRGARATRRRVGRAKFRLEDLEAKHIKLAEQVRRRLERQLVDKGPHWIPDAGFMGALDTAARVVKEMSRSMRLAREAERKLYDGMSEAQIREVLLVQLQHTAAELDEDVWRSLLTTGMGEDIAEAAIALWKQRAVENAAAAAAGSARTQFRAKGAS